MEIKKSIKSLNPNAPEFSPAITRKPKPSHHPPPMLYANKSFPCKAFTGTDVKKPGNRPFRHGFRNPRSLPPRLLKKKLYVPKNLNFSSPKVVPLREYKLDGKTSVMIKNIPNCLGRTDLLRMLDNHCRKYNGESSYDFLYIPMDFVNGANLGYAFVNFTSSVAAESFRGEFDNFSWDKLGFRKKICEITVAKFQGKEELSQHFKNSRFACHTDDYLPVILSPPSDGFTWYTLTTLGYRVGLRRGGGSRRGSWRQCF